MPPPGRIHSSTASAADPASTEEQATAVDARGIHFLKVRVRGPFSAAGPGGGASRRLLRSSLLLACQRRRRWQRGGRRSHVDHRTHRQGAARVKPCSQPIQRRAPLALVEIVALCGPCLRSPATLARGGRTRCICEAALRLRQRQPQQRAFWDEPHAAAWRSGAREPSKPSWQLQQPAALERAPVLAVAAANAACWRPLPRLVEEELRSCWQRDNRRTLVDQAGLGGAAQGAREPAAAAGDRTVRRCGRCAAIGRPREAQREVQQREPQRRGQRGHQSPAPPRPTLVAHLRCRCWPRRAGRREAQGAEPHRKGNPQDMHAHARMQSRDHMHPVAGST